MKKILSVSILAVLAVAPLSARADVIDVPGVADTTSDGMVNGVATTNYVKGAYNALQAPVNNIKDAMNVTGLSEIVQGKQEHYIEAGTGVATNLKALDTAARAHQDMIGNTAMGTTAGTITGAIAELKSGLTTSGNETAVGAGKNYVKTTNTVGGNFNALDDAISKVAHQDGDTNHIVKDSLNNDGTLKTTVSQNLVNLGTALENEISDRTTAIGTVTDTTTLTPSASVGTNLDRLAGAVQTLNGNTTVEAGDLPSSGTNYITATADAAANLVTLNAQLRTVTDNLATATGASALDANGTYHYVNKDNSVAANLTALDGQVYTNTTNIGTLSGLDTTAKSDLVAAINEVDAKVLTVYSSWNLGGTPQGSAEVGLDDPS